jgi:Cu(I)/Ag(I) efflux system membrane fusion protein
VVFLDKGEGRFEPAEVKLGGKFDGYYEVLAGVSAGERIIASASFLLDSESRLKEAMGAMAGMPGMDMGEGGKKPAAAEGPREKKVGDLTLVFETQPAKPKAGETTLRLKAQDTKRNSIENAHVIFVSNMTMPGMAPTKVEGKYQKSGFYEAKVNLGMAGQWEVTVIVQRPSQKEIREQFNIAVQ